MIGEVVINQDSIFIVKSFYLSNYLTGLNYVTAANLGHDKSILVTETGTTGSALPGEPSNLKTLIWIEMELNT